MIDITQMTDKERDEAIKRVCDELEEILKETKSNFEVVNAPESFVREWFELYGLCSPYSPRNIILKAMIKALDESIKTYDKSINAYDL